MSAFLDRVRAFTHRLSNVGRRGALERDLDEELRFHQAMLTRDFEHAGAAPADARLTAKRRVGNPLALRERSADAWGFAPLEDFWRDARFGVRTLGRSPAFVAIAVVAIAIGIGVNAGFFTLVDALVWQPIPVAHPERMVKLLTTGTRGQNGIRFSYLDVRTISAHARRITDLIAYDAEAVGVELTPGSPARTASAGIVSGNYFATLGGSAALGRVLTADDARAGAPPAVVLSDRFWANAFGRSRAIVGSDLIVNGVHVTVAGVARPDFVGINPLVPDFWIALPAAATMGITPGRLDDPANRFIFLHARLAPSATVAQARAELSGMVADRQPAEDPAADPDRVIGADLVPNESFVPPNPQILEAIAPVGLYGIVGLAVRQRRRDIAVHIAMGAGTRHVLRLVLHRELRLVATGIAAGIVIALGEARLIANLVLPLPSLGALGFAVLAAALLLVAGIAAFIPARAALRIAPMQVLRQE